MKPQVDKLRTVTMPHVVLVRADVLSSDPEGLRANASIAGGDHEMAPRSEVAIDHFVR